MPPPVERPLLVYDGDCTFCKAWVGYWKQLTAGRVDFEPSASAGPRHPEVPAGEFRQAVQFFEGEHRTAGGEAVARLLSYSSWGRSPQWLYERVPGLAFLTEFFYKLIAAHRNAGYWITRFLWGKSPVPATYDRSAAYFARAIALIYFVAFASFGQQVRGLIGAQGIQPVNEFFVEVTRQFGTSGFWRVPSLFWWVRSELGLEMIVWSGAVIAFVASIARPHTSGQRAAFVLLFFYYLSVVNAGQVFMGYQWDYLLLEAGFLAIFLKPTWTRTWLFRWLLFRLMLESGAVKLLSHDLTWSSLTALNYHFYTQPLPTPVAWYLAQAPQWFLRLSTAFVFGVELLLPFFILGPRRLKHVAASGIILLQVLILASGNYTFFNYLTIALCLFLMDDAFWTRLLGPKKAPRASRRGVPSPARAANPQASLALAILIVVLSLTGLLGMFGVPVPVAISEAEAPLGSFGIVNQYGLFASMTTSRPEISIEGSYDGMNWQPYLFRYKPGPTSRAPRWIAPFQPRLDWQMWFAALGSYRENPWLLRLMMRLLQGSTPVLQLLEENPFASQPPKLVRALVYDYRFTSAEERSRTGDWWKRELKGTYFPPIGLRGQP